MRGGKLRHRITFQVPTKTQNNFGEQDWVWEDDNKAWCQILPIRGEEYHYTRQAKSIVTHRLIMRYVKLSDGSRPTPENCQIIYFDHKVQETRTFDVQAVFTKLERKIEMEILAVEVS